MARNLKLKKEQQIKEKEQYIEKLAVKKVNNIIKTKTKLKKDFGIPPEDSDEEAPIVQIQPKKPKKKQIVYLPPESDSEEEIIYKKAPKRERPQQIAQPTPPPQPPQPPKPRLIFF